LNTLDILKKSQKWWPKLARDWGNFCHNVIKIGNSNYLAQFKIIFKFSLEVGYKTGYKMLKNIK